MDALDRFLTAPATRPCQECRYARATAHDGLWCDRGTIAPFPCEVERASSPVEAWLYGACGRHGRFFEARTATAPEWVAKVVAGRAQVVFSTSGATGQDPAPIERIARAVDRRMER